VIVPSPKYELWQRDLVSQRLYIGFEITNLIKKVYDEVGSSLFQNFWVTNTKLTIQAIALCAGVERSDRIIIKQQTIE